jgi:hypothetical protein
MPDYTQGALVKKSANQSLSNNTLTVLTFNTEGYNDGGWHDNAVNNSRLTVPSGVTLVKIFGSVRFAANNTGDRLTRLLKNGVSTAAGLPGQSWAASVGANRARMCWPSPPLEVTTGDYFELEAWQNSGGALNAETDPTTFFGIMELNASTKRAMAKLSSSFAISSALDYIDWDTTEYDTDSFWSALNPSRLTIPSGVSKVRLFAGVRADTTAITHLFCNIDKNGASFLGGGALEPEAMAGGLTTRVAIASAPVIVTPSDYFEVQTRANTSANIQADANTYLAIEVIE